MTEEMLAHIAAKVTRAYRAGYEEALDDVLCDVDGYRQTAEHDGEAYVVSALSALRDAPKASATFKRMTAAGSARRRRLTPPGAAPLRVASPRRRNVVAGRSLRVLIACEFSGVVRRAFQARGHYAVSCDLLPAEDGGEHIQGDVRDVLGDGWDVLIAHPPCTHLAVSGARWFKEKQQEQTEALAFVKLLLDAPVPRIALENPISIISSRIRKPDQIIQPWQFGHGETKATCLWLKNLPKLTPTSIVEGRVARVHREPPGPERWKNRSRTYEGIAAAMAEQWGRIDA